MGRSWAIRILGGFQCELRDGGGAVRWELLDSNRVRIILRLLFFSFRIYH